MTRLGLHALCRPVGTAKFKSTPHSHAIRGLLNSRALLVKVQRDLENQVRGLLKSVGLIIGRAKDGVFSTRTKQLLAMHASVEANPRQAPRALSYWSSRNEGRPGRT
jgi:transposase